MPRPQLAITIDDLPTMCMEDLPGGSLPHGDDSGLGAARAILAAIRRHAIPVAVFVNSARFRLDDLNLLREWCDAGAELGNHTASHLCVDSVSEATWQADVLSCHDVLSSIKSSPPRFFRFPYLRAGSSSERKRAARMFLTELGYTIAPVTAVTSEWVLAHYYHLAFAAQAHPVLEDISARLVPHVVASLEAAERLARVRVRRTIPQIVLFHVNQLTADRIDDLIQVLGRKYELISIDEALRDPFFTMPDRYVGPRGGSWLARVGNSMTADTIGARNWFANERRAILQTFQPILGWPLTPDTHK
jgi:peptidoglycan/xylan/chitin deacetylase (PgdA/CDA1 family)